LENAEDTVQVGTMFLEAMEEMRCGELENQKVEQVVCMDEDSKNQLKLDEYEIGDGAYMTKDEEEQSPRAIAQLYNTEQEND
jgi:hypothetical protein